MTRKKPSRFFRRRYNPQIAALERAIAEAKNGGRLR